MPSLKGYEMELDCPHCGHRFMISDSQKPIPTYIKTTCPKCGKKLEHAIVIKKR
jgi:predicted Zn finger-like uncharacterized protein